MALKDLVAQKAKLTEQAIENIISDYARYDVESRAVVFTPQAVNLSNKGKILVFLVAQQGWQYVLDEAVDVAVTPSKMEGILGIGGGTLRPTLKELKDRHLVLVKAGKYAVSSASLHEIESEISPNPTVRASRSKRVVNRKDHGSKKGSQSAESTEKKTPSPSLAGSKSANRAASGSKAAVIQSIEDGFFDEGCTAAELLQNLHERAFMVPRTSIPGYLIEAVRSEQLTRRKEMVDGKNVWVYRTKG